MTDVVCASAELPSAPAAKLPAMAAPVTSVAFAPRATAGGGGCSGGGRDVLAVGLESGELELWSVTWQPGSAADGRPLSCTGASLHIFLIQLSVA